MSCPSSSPSRPAVLALAVLTCAVAACKSQRTVTESKQSLGPILQKFAGNYDIERDATGIAQVKSDRRSEFESRPFAGTSTAKVDKEFRTSEFQGNKSFLGRKDFQGNKEFVTGKPAREAGQKSRWHTPWKGGKTAREAEKSYAGLKDFDRGKDVAKESAREGEKSYPTRQEPQTQERWNYPDEALQNITAPNPGSGPGPTIRDVRTLLGKDG